MREAPGFTAEFADLILRPFQRGGRGDPGFDCYGLISEVERRNGRHLPPWSSPDGTESIAQAIASNTPLFEPCKKGPGAIAAIRIGRYVGHVGIITAQWELLHCLDQFQGVCKSPLSEWERRIAGYYTYIGTPS